MNDNRPLPDDRPGFSEETAGPGLDLVDAVGEAVERGDAGRVEELVAPLHAADTADLIEDLTAEERKQLLAMIGPKLDPETLTHIDGPLRPEITQLLGIKTVAHLLKGLDSDDAFEFFEDLSDKQQAKIFARVPKTIQRFWQEGLQFPEDSAGRMMQREVVVVPNIWTVGETIDFMRTHRREIVSDFYDLYIVDPRYRPIGKVPLSRVLRNKRPVRVQKLLDDDIHPIPANLDQEEVAHVFRQYSLVSAPVVNEVGRLVGVITVDDVVHVIDEEAEEDLLKLGGVKEIDLYSDVLQTTRSRFSWLVLNLMTAIAASLVIGLFEGTIEQIVALAVLMPIVASMGGNAGTQALTIAVRAIAMKDLSAGTARRFITKEAAVGLLNGVLFAVLSGCVAIIWFGDLALGAVIGAAMIVNMFVAGVFGTLIPITLERFKVDPAVASSIFLTTVTDVVGFFAFLGLAAVFLL